MASAWCSDCWGLLGSNPAVTSGSLPCRVLLWTCTRSVSSVPSVPPRCFPMFPGSALGLQVCMVSQMWPCSWASCCPLSLAGRDLGTVAGLSVWPRMPCVFHGPMPSPFFLVSFLPPPLLSTVTQGILYFCVFPWSAVSGAPSPVRVLEAHIT